MALMLHQTESMKSFIALLLVSFLFQNICSANSLSIFRIGDLDLTQEQNDLGHCTGFYIHNSGEIITAAHCNHQKDFRVISQSGKTLLSLHQSAKFYETNSLGPYDLLSIHLNEIQEQELLNNKDLLFNNYNENFQILGFPTALREKPLFALNCTPYQDYAKEFSKFWIEQRFETFHLKCDHSNQDINSTSVKDFKHHELAGMSGGPVIYKNNVIGLIYHYEEPRSTNTQSYYKIQLFPKKSNYLPEALAIQRYQLNTKIFETLKIPNLILIKINELLITFSKLDFKSIDSISNMKITENQDLEISFNNGSTTETFHSSLVPVSVVRFVKEYSAPQKLSLKF